MATQLPKIRNQKMNILIQKFWCCNKMYRKHKLYVKEENYLFSVFVGIRAKIQRFQYKNGKKTALVISHITRIERNFCAVKR